MPLAVSCHECGHPLFAAEGLTRISCPECGAVTQLSPSSADAASVTETGPIVADFSDGGTVSYPPASTNPYEAPLTMPAAAASHSTRRRGFDPYKADLWSRFAGNFLDGLFMMVFVIFALFVVEALYAVGSTYVAGELNVELTTYGAAFVFLLFQSILIAQSGQSLGKKIMGTQIVNFHNDDIPNIARSVLIRTWLTQLLGCIPFFGLIDALMIFGNESRCLHDYMAGTRVISLNRRRLEMLKSGK